MPTNVEGDLQALIEKLLQDRRVSEFKYEVEGEVGWSTTYSPAKRLLCEHVKLEITLEKD